LIVSTIMTIQARGEIIILESTAPGLKSGQVLADSARINIPAGKRAQLILPSGRTKTLKGPFSGDVSSLTRSEKSNAGLFKRVMDAVRKSGRDDTGFAAVRRLGGSGGMSGSGPSWTSVPADKSGTYCLAKGAPPLIMRPRNISLKKLTLRNRDSNKAATITWNRGQKSVPWPPALLPADNSHYSFKLAGRAEKELTFRMMPRDELNDENLLRALDQRGCQKQLAAWLRAHLKN